MAVVHKDTLIKDIIYYIPEASPELEALQIDLKDAIARGITIDQACREHNFDTDTLIEYMWIRLEEMA